MTKTNCLAGGIKMVLCAAFMGAVTGCVVEPRHRTVYAPPPPDYVEGVVVLQDDYFYYPDYQVYYSSSRRQYVYMEGRSWVTRTSPSHVSVDVLFASPSVRLDFHDSPALHHPTILRQYPKHWSPPDSRSKREQGNRDNGKGNDHKDRK